MRVVSYTATCYLLLVMSVELSVEQDCNPAINSVPYITFMGARLSNHSYLEVGQLGNDSNVLQCHTDFPNCCNSSSESQTGQWVLPDQSVISPGESEVSLYTVLSREQGIDLAFNGAPQDAMEGLFHCEIPTIGGLESVYVGLFPSDKYLFVEEVAFTAPDDDFDVKSPQFPVTCISSGGPVTCVEWTKSGSVIPDPDTSSVVLDAVEGRYMHTLTIYDHETAPGDYACTVHNDRPNSFTGEPITVYMSRVPPNLFIEQLSPTSIQAHWVLPLFLEKEHGFTLSYTGGSSGSVHIDNQYTNNHIFTGLENGANYTMTIYTTSTDPQTLPSTEAVSNLIHMVPGEPELRLFSVSLDSLSFSWSVPSGSVVDSYDVWWQFQHTTLVTFKVTLAPTRFNNHTIIGLRDYGDATLSISVTAFNAVGNRSSAVLTVATDSVDDSEAETQASCGTDDAVIIGAVVGGCVIIAIAAVVVAILIYHYKWKSTKDIAEAYELDASTVVGRQQYDHIKTVNNSSYGGSLLDLQAQWEADRIRQTPDIVGGTTNTVFSNPRSTGNRGRLMNVPLPPPPPPPGLPPPPALSEEDEQYDNVRLP